MIPSVNTSQIEIQKKFLKRLEVLNTLELPKDQYVIWGSGPLAIRGLRDARDIDLVISQSLWVNLSQKHRLEGPKNNKINIGEVDIWNDLLNLTNKIDEIIANCDLIEGFPFMQLSWTLEWKKYWNSKKDPADLVLIKEYLKNKELFESKKGLGSNL